MKGKNKVLFSNDRLLESPIQSKIDKNLILMAHPIDGIVFFRVSNSGLIRKLKYKNWESTWCIRNKGN